MTAARPAARYISRCNNKRQQQLTAAETAAREGTRERRHQDAAVRYGGMRQKPVE